MGIAMTITLLLVCSDQLSKMLIRSALPHMSEVAVIDRFFYLFHIRNSGAAWSFLANKSWGIHLLTALSAVVSVLLIVVIKRCKPLDLRIPLVLILAGSIGNFIDRVRLGYVTDFLSFRFGSYVFPTFNIADAYIVCGMICLMITLLRRESAFADLEMAFGLLRTSDTTPRLEDDV